MNDIIKQPICQPNLLADFQKKPTCLITIDFETFV